MENSREMAGAAAPLGWGRKILLVEDSPTQAERMRHQLEQEGYEVDLARDGREGLARVRERTPDVVLTDVVMPEMNGYQLCRAIKDDPELRDIPVIMLTTLSNPEDVIGGLECGADNFIVKPPDKAYLIACIHRVLANARLENVDGTLGVEIFFSGQRHCITSSRQQILNLLLSTYETAVQKNLELSRARDELQALNEHLEEKVEGRTAALLAEISERKRTEEALRESEERFRRSAANAEDTVYRFFTLSLDLLAIAGFDGHFKRLNPAWEKTLGYPVAELLARPWLDFVHPDDREATIAVGQRLAGGEELVSFENRYVCRDGSYRWLHWSAAPFLRDRTIYAVARDVTQTKAYEQNLRDSEKRLRDITSTLGEGVYVVDSDGRVTFMNPEAGRLLGWSESEVLGRALHDVIHSRQKDGSAETPPVLQTLRSGSIRRVEEDTYFRKDGTPLPVAYIATPLLENGNIVGCVVAFQDITARKELDRLKNEFVSTVSHELRTPLASLRGFTELMLKREFDKEKRREFIGIIHTESIRLTNLINDFLDIQRMESGRQVYRFERVSLPQLFDEAVTLFSQGEAKHELIVDVPPDLPRVRADADRIRQVLANLMSNALKFSLKRGTVRLRARPDGASVEVSVQDSGIGIAPEAITSLFKKFFRVDAPECRAIGGTGLGLSLVKEIVEAHRGRVWAESEPGKGSIFSFTLPVEETVAAAPTVAAETIADVLLVEDHPTYAQLLKAHLENDGRAVAHTRYGEDAVDLARKVRPCAILLDIHLAGKTDGWDVLLALKSDPELQAIPVIIMSTSESRLRGLALEGAEYVPKSAHPTQLLEAIHRRLPSLQGRSVLIVDDDENFRHSVAQLLSLEGAVDIGEAAGGQEALERIAQQMPDLLVLDFLMPDMDGLELLRRLRRNRDAVNLHVLLVTGKTLTPNEKDYLTRPMAGSVAQRGTALDDISAMVRQTLSDYPPPAV